MEQRGAPRGPKLRRHRAAAALLSKNGGMATVLLCVAGAAVVAAAAPVLGIAADGAVTIVLREETGSGVTGSAILTAADARTVVGLIVRGTTGGLPAHLHRG